MAGPFPGVDPYVEVEGYWHDFRHSLISGICGELGSTLPLSYFARVDERIDVAEEGIRVRDPDEIRDMWVEVRALPGLELVTTIEVLSPINKSSQRRQAYLDKRDELHSSRVNLVEIDLLLGGPPLPMKQQIEPGSYYAIVARRARLPIAELYRWTVRDPLPRIPIPLREPDPDVFIDLAALVRRVYDLGRYSLTLRRNRPLPYTTPLTPEDRAWVESVAMNADAASG